MKTVTVGSIIAFTCMIGFSTVEAFTCYKCSSNEHELCIEEPDQLPLSSTTECDDSGYCTLVQTEYTDIPGIVVTLVRDCEKEPLILNGVRTDKHYTKMYTSCNSERCNSGDGKREPGEGDGVRTGPKDVITVYESDSSWMNKPSYLFALMGTMCIYLLH